MEQDDDYIMQKYMEYDAEFFCTYKDILITMYVKLYLKIK